MNLSDYVPNYETVGIIPADFAIENLIPVVETEKVQFKPQVSEDDFIEGTSGNDNISGGLGDDILKGLDGSDTYIFNKGDGKDIIDDDGYRDTDRLIINGYTAGEVEFSRLAEDLQTLVITFAGTNDRITVSSTLEGSNADQIEIIELDDGTQWTSDHIRELLHDKKETSGEDRIIGSSYGETLEGGLGDDILKGLDGSDTYIFNKGDGKDIIDDDGYRDTDKLIINGYTAGEVEFSRLAEDLQTLVITFAGTNDRITVSSTLEGSNADQIEIIELDDGTQWTSDQIRELFHDAKATDGDDRIVGSSYDETLEGGLGDDILKGLDGSDTYIFNKGDGKDIIDDDGYRDTDKLIINGYTAGEVEFSRLAEDLQTLVITFAGTNDRITVSSTLEGSNADQIEIIELDDGTQWTSDQIRELFHDAKATDGDDRIVGSSYDETLEGGLGDDILKGLDGSDTYIFNKGDGKDIIDDDGYRDTDKLIINGYTPDEVILSRLADGLNTLVITFAGTDDRVTIENTLANDNADTIELIQFADGTLWDLSDINNIVVEQSSSDGSDVVIGLSGGDIITGGKGDDRLIGLDGSDIYVYRRGDGRDAIEDNGNGDTDIVRIEGYAPNEVSYFEVVYPADSLLIRFPDSGDELTIVNTLDSSAADQIEEVHFDDGTILTIDQIKGQILTDRKTASDDEITGFNANDTLEGGLGDDVLRGDGGDDVYVYTRGDGYDLVIEGSGDSGDQLNLIGITPDQVQIRRGVDDDLEVLISETAQDAGDGGRVTVRGSFVAGNTVGIESIAFEDGTVWTRAEFEPLAARNVATQGDDRLEGTSDNDVLEGLGGDDLLVGGIGDDVYRFAKGDGQDLIRDNGDGSDTIEISGYALSELSFTRRGRDGQDLIVRPRCQRWEC